MMIEIEKLDCLKEEQIKKLKGQWINYIEELLYICELPEGFDGIKKLLEIDDSELQKILQCAREISGVATSSEEKGEVVKKPLGLRVPNEILEKWGIKKEEKHDGE